ncbi:response regulator [Agarilytica rhodophyticola]|uniref:response regulator n=1 Tax=Agarilytica rhodophyticola TaxID=1737490 RepID=UPI000B344BFE|nr:response regulator [Agarilytica rhodophyticola]
MLLDRDQEITSSILLVDDEASVLKSLTRLLKQKSYTVETAQNGEAGLTMLRNKHFDLVVCDMQMPYMNGAKFLGKAKLLSPHTAQILLTGEATLEDTIAAINQGQVQAYVSKPWDSDKLIRTIELALYAQQLELEKKELQQLTQKDNRKLLKLNHQLQAQLATKNKS